MALFLCVLLALSAGLAGAAAPENELDQWQATLDAAQQALDQDFHGGDPASAEEQLQQILRRTQEQGQALRKSIDTDQKNLAQLGEPPADGTAEDEEVTRLRAQLTKSLSEARARSTRIELIDTRAKTLLGDMSTWQRAQLRQMVLQRSPAPVTPDVWRKAGSDGQRLVRNVLRLPTEWWLDHVQREPRLRLLWLLALPLLGLVIGWLLRRWILRHFARDPRELQPSYARRIAKALTDGVANAVVPVAVIALLTGVLAWQGMLTGLFGYLVYAVVTALSVTLIVYGMWRAALAPRRVHWRIVPVRPAAIHPLLRALGAVLVLLATSTVLLNAAWRARQLTGSLEATFFLVQSVLTTLPLAVLLTPKYWAPPALTRRSAAEHRRAHGLAPAEPIPTAAPRTPFWIPLLWLARAVVLLSPLLALAGWGRLAFTLQWRLAATGALVGAVVLARLAARELLENLLRKRLPRRAPGSTARDESAAASAGKGGSGILLYWATLALDIALLVPSAYLLLLIDGIPLSTLRLWTGKLLSGISIGNITVSLTDLLFALLVLVLGIVATNLVRRWTATRLLPNTRLDRGARDSVAIGTSYLGIAVTVLLAVSALGIDMSHLALIVGALSLGIGFGLQNLVQNFAAGILLLIERPIKVGDWIRIDGIEGTVKRISVRSTEVEVFDRSAVFIPNSDLIARPVVNRTHRNAMARLELPIRVTQGCDPREVERILLACAHEQAHVRRNPAPYVWFRGFAEGTFNFELRVYIDHTDYWITVDSSLYFAIAAALREAGITIPVPLREVRVRSRAHDERPATAPEPEPEDQGLSAPDAS